MIRLNTILLVGGWHTLVLSSLGDLLGVEKLAKAYGLVQLAIGTAYLTTSPLHGKIHYYQFSLLVIYIFMKDGKRKAPSFQKNV